MGLLSMHMANIRMVSHHMHNLNMHNRHTLNTASLPTDIRLNNITQAIKGEIEVPCFLNWNTLLTFIDHPCIHRNRLTLLSRATHMRNSSKATHKV